jgi:hypothetical protein
MAMTAVQLDAQVLERLCRQFSCPQEPHDDRLTSTIVTEHARANVSTALARFESEIETRSTGLYALIKSWCAGDIDFSTAWTPAVAEAETLLRRGGTDPVLVAARIGLSLAAGSRPCKWSAVFTAPARLAWDRFALPETTDIAVACSGSEATVRVHESSREFRFTRLAQEWRTDALAGFPRPLAELPIILVPSGRPPFDARDFTCFPDCNETDEVEDCASSFASGFRFLMDQQSTYTRWVARVVVGLVVYRSRRPGWSSSGSYRDVPGFVQASYPSSSVQTAELLVHEASHQYWAIIKRLGDVDGGTDSRLYFSPPVGTNRPLSSIVIAYHAFANVMLFYRKCLERGIEADGQCMANERRLRGELEVLDCPLRNNVSLTPLGRTLYEPLRSRIAPLLAG